MSDRKDMPGAGLGQLFGRPEADDPIREAETLQPCPACHQRGICSVCLGGGSLLREHLDGTYDTTECPACLNANGQCRICEGVGMCTRHEASHWQLTRSIPP